MRKFFKPIRRQFLLAVKQFLLEKMIVFWSIFKQRYMTIKKIGNFPRRGESYLASLEGLIFHAWDLHLPLQTRQATHLWSQSFLMLLLHRPFHPHNGPLGGLRGRKRSCRAHCHCHRPWPLSKVSNSLNIGFFMEKAFLVGEKNIGDSPLHYRTACIVQFLFF